MVNEALRPNHQMLYLQTRLSQGRAKLGLTALQQVMDIEIMTAKQIADEILSDDIEPITAEVHGLTIAGSVYIVQAGDKVKVGYSSKPTHRLTDLRIGSPVPLSLVGMLWVYGEDAQLLERAFHKRNRDRRSHGEWFDMTPREAAQSLGELAQSVGAACAGPEAMLWNTHERRREEQAYLDALRLKGRLPANEYAELLVGVGKVLKWRLVAA